MTNKELINYCAAPLFFILMLVDAHVTRAFHGMYIWNSHVLLLLMMFSVKLLSKRYLITTALILGGIFDLYYIGVLGIYAVVMPLMVWAMYLLEDAIYENIFTQFFGMVILVTVFELFTMGIQVFFRLTTINPVFFVTRFLGPTLLLNIVIFFLLYLLYQRLFERE